MENEETYERNGIGRRGHYCAECRKKLELGEDVLTVESGVLGPRGIVPLEEPLVFCSALCMIGQFSGRPSDEPTQLPRRVP